MAECFWTSRVRTVEDCVEEAVDTSVVLLMHMDGDLEDATGNATPMAWDSANDAFAIPPVFASDGLDGTSCFNMQGQAFYQTLADIDISAIPILDSDVTIEFFIKSEVSFYGSVVLFLKGNYDNIYFNLRTSNILRFGLDSTLEVTLPLTGLTHVAFVFSNTTGAKVFVGGELKVSAPEYTHYFSDTSFRILGSSRNEQVIRIDELRISKSARYIEGFPPPTEPFS